MSSYKERFEEYSKIKDQLDFLYPGCKFTALVKAGDPVVTLDRWNNKESVVTVPGFVSAIGPGAFGKNEKINRVIIPANVEYIAEFAFADCR